MLTTYFELPDLGGRHKLRQALPEMTDGQATPYFQQLIINSTKSDLTASHTKHNHQQIPSDQALATIPTDYSALILNQLKQSAEVNAQQKSKRKNKNQH